MVKSQGFFRCCLRSRVFLLLVLLPNDGGGGPGFPSLVKNNIFFGLLCAGSPFLLNSEFFSSDVSYLYAFQILPVSLLIQYCFAGIHVTRIPSNR